MYQFLARIRASRGLSIPVLGGLLAIGLLLPAPGSAATVYTRYDSCPSSGFYPTSSATPWDTSGTLRYTTAISASFRCAAGLPHGAVLKAVEFDVYDNDGSGSVSCGVAETSNGVNNIGVTNSVATSTSGTPGDTTLVATTSWTIDLQNHGYFYECYISGDAPDSDLGIRQVTAKFKITASKC